MQKHIAASSIKGFSVICQPKLKNKYVKTLTSSGYTAENARIAGYRELLLFSSDLKC